MTWQSIETAPKDGTEILLHCINEDGANEGCVVSKFFQGEWVTFAALRLNCDDSDPGDSLYPTHWMPLPPPPEDNK